MVVVWSLFPIYWALNTSLSTNVAAQSTPVQWWPSHVKFTAYQALFGAGPESQDAAGGIARSLINITVEATGATILTFIVSVLAAYAFARLQFRLKSVLFYVVIGTLMLPVYATLIPLYRIMADLRLVDTYTGHNPRLYVWVRPAGHVDHVQRVHGAAPRHGGGRLHRRGVDDADVPQDRAADGTARDRSYGDRHVPVRLEPVHFPAGAQQ